MSRTSSATTANIVVPLPRWLWWLGMAYLVLAIMCYAAALPVRSTHLSTNPALSSAQVVVQLASEYLLIVVASCLGIFLMLRRPHERITLLTALTLVCGLPNLLALSVLAGELHPLFSVPGAMVLILSGAFALLFLIALPDGRFFPRWLLGLIPIFVIWDMIRYQVFFVWATPESLRIRPATLIINMAFLSFGFVAMLYRYRYRATPIQRQQFKWFFLGIYSAVLTLGIGTVLRILTSILGDAASLTTANFLFSILNAVGGILMYVGLALSIMRYGLWDVDLTINRSLVTGAVTVILLLLFALVFGVIQTLLRGILGEAQGEVAVAVAAVTVTGAFNPVRRRVRTFVDRRLYGLRFDLNQLQRRQQKPDVENPGALTGRSLGGYELLGVLGRGGMGEVYKGYADGKLAAIKIMHDVHLLDTSARQRFAREGNITLAHPNIVQTYGYGEEEGIAFVALEFVEGQTLKDVLRERGRLALDDVLPFLLPLAEAIDTAHTAGYVHRDIKPANIMLRLHADQETYEAVLMDFGIAKILGGTTSLTGSGAVGTIDYMAPEQIMSANTVDHRADIYALGVVLYEVLTGVPPFSGNPGQVLFAHIQQPPPDARQLVPELAADVSDVITRALAKTPEQRYQSASAFVAALSSNGI